MHSQTFLEGSPRESQKIGCLRQVIPQYRFICTVFGFKGTRKCGCLRQVTLNTVDHINRFDCIYFYFLLIYLSIYFFSRHEVDNDYSIIHKLTRDSFLLLCCRTRNSQYGDHDTCQMVGIAREYDIKEPRPLSYVFNQLYR